MEVAKIVVTRNEAKVIDRHPLTCGMIGATVRVEYIDPMWDELDKLVVFSGAMDIGILSGDEVVEIPQESLAIPGVMLRFGVCGSDAYGEEVIPTTWAELGKVLKGTPVEADTPGAPVLPAWAQILGMIGDLNNLETEARDNLVAAINEAVARGGNGNTPGGYYTPVVDQPETGVMEITYVPSMDGMPEIAPVRIQIPAGKDGADGKSAYAYAQDGGFTGTEEEFAQKLAEGDTLCVTITKVGDGVYTADYSASSIYRAFQDKKIVFCKLNNERYDLVNVSSFLGTYTAFFVCVRETNLTSILIQVNSVTVNEHNLAFKEDVDGKLDASKLPEAINTALSQAKASGEFDGAKGEKGDKGEDGISPIVTVAAIAGGHRITITDATGTKTVDVMDGKDGTNGSGGGSSGVWVGSEAPPDDSYTVWIDPAGEDPTEALVDMVIDALPVYNGEVEAV